jgi:hypothetical protein
VFVIVACCLLVADGAMQRVVLVDEDGVMDCHDKNVGGEWKRGTILRPASPRCVSYCNRGNLQRYFYFLPILASLALQIL